MHLLLFILQLHALGKSLTVTTPLLLFLLYQSRPWLFFISSSSSTRLTALHPVAGQQASCHRRPSLRLQPATVTASPSLVLLQARFVSVSAFTQLLTSLLSIFIHCSSSSSSVQFQPSRHQLLQPLQFSRRHRPSQPSAFSCASFACSSLQSLSRSLFCLCSAVVTPSATAHGRASSIAAIVSIECFLRSPFSAASSFALSTALGFSAAVSARAPSRPFVSVISSPAPSHNSSLSSQQATAFCLSVAASLFLFGFENY